MKCSVEVRVPLDGRPVLCDDAVIQVFNVPSFDDPPPESWRRECDDRVGTWRMRLLPAGLGGAAIGLGGAAIGLVVVAVGRRLLANPEDESILPRPRS